MGITPIGCLALLPLAQSAGIELEPVPMARVGRTSRTEDETYSPSKGGYDSPSGSQESGSQAQDHESREEGQGLQGEASEGGTRNGENSPTEPSSVAAPRFDLLGDSSAKVSFFA